MARWIVVGVLVVAVVVGCLLVGLTLPWGGSRVQFTVESMDITRPSEGAICFSAYGDIHKTKYDQSFSTPTARLYRRCLFGKTPVVSTDDVLIEVGKTYTGLLFYDSSGNIDGILPTNTLEHRFRSHIPPRPSN